MKKSSELKNHHIDRKSGSGYSEKRSALSGPNSTNSQNSSSSAQMSGGASPFQGQNQSREKEQGDLRSF